MRKYWLLPVIIVVIYLLARPRTVGHPTALHPDGLGPTNRSPATTPSAVGAALPTIPNAAGGAIDPTAVVEQLEASPTPIPTAPALRPPAPIITLTPLPLPAASSDLPPLVPTVEPPALEPEVAPPTPADGPNPSTQAAAPTRLVIPAIGLDLAPVPVGVDRGRVPIVPRHDVGWYTSSATPGQGSNIVFWGHVLRWKDSPHIPAPFARVHELQPGADLVVSTADGQERRYRVSQQIQVNPEDVQYVYPTDAERVTLVSCIGDKVIENGTLTKEFRLITIAEPVE